MHIKGLTDEGFKAFISIHFVLYDVFFISGITTLKAVGFIEHFFSMWMSAWIIAWMFAFPSVLICAPIAQRIVNFILKDL
ncbi:hypothetical protein Q674_15190 [Acinetobacter sp. COS3]|nr:hypothetical protein Q674_15190 [Acinetobacter sp. COS3]